MSDYQFNSSAQQKGERLIMAASRGDLVAVRECLSDPKTDVNTKSMRCAMRGHSALAHAAAGGHTAVMEFLMAKGARINQVANYGWRENLKAPQTAHTDGRTALHEAVRKRQKEAVRLLIAHGAKADIADGQGLTPLMLARTETSPDPDVIALLEQGISQATQRKPSKRSQP